MATLSAPDHVSFLEDAESIKKSVEGWGTDEKAIVSILAHRTAAQRKQIKQAYWDRYQEDLIKRLESELSGDFEKAVYRWMLDPEDRDAVLANVAMRKSLDYHVIVELSSIHSAEELLAVRKAYQARYKRSLEEDLAAHTFGDSRKLLVGLVTAYRYEGTEINALMAKKEADILQDALKDNAANGDEVIRIVTTRSKTQLLATFNAYRELYGTSITKALQNESGDEFKKLLRTAIRGLTEPYKYYEKILRNAINKKGTDEDALTRVIVTRAEKDLKQVKEMYYKRNSVTLTQAVAKDTSGDYKAFLLALLGDD
ncbi:Annexin-like protein RJ4 [Linum grandiflorum]